MKQQREILRREKETADKIAARAFAQNYLSDLVPSVFGTLADNGYFFDPVERGKSSVISNIYNNDIYIKSFVVIIISIIHIVSAIKCSDG